ncbi:MAG TPA: CcdB family protein [Stellaceae bacterium]|nr:CcdB family protein [Stellaceae bacterium]
MARFEVFEIGSGSGYVLDVQADLMSDLSTRVVVPLLKESDAPRAAKGLNPVFEIGGENWVMLTQFMASIPKSELRRRVGSLAHQHAAIMNALDMLLIGF